MDTARKQSANSNPCIAMSWRLVTIIIVFLAIGASSIGDAMARPDSRRMTCKQVQSMINRSGAVVLTTGKYTYERYVKHYTLCDYDQITRTYGIPTRDTNYCPVKKCEDASIYYPWDD